MDPLSSGSGWHSLPTYYNYINNFCVDRRIYSYISLFQQWFRSNSLKLLLSFSQLSLSLQLLLYLLLVKRKFYMAWFMITYLWSCHDVVSLQAQAWRTQSTRITPNWYPVIYMARLDPRVSHLPRNIRFNTKWSAGQAISGLRRSGERP